jgi:hypothetical protein
VDFLKRKNNIDNVNKITEKPEPDEDRYWGSVLETKEILKNKNKIKLNNINLIEFFISLKILMPCPSSRPA